MNIKFEIDKRDVEFAQLTITDDNNNYASYMYIQEKENVYSLCSFTFGKVNNCEFRKDDIFPKSYMKNGRGRVSQKDIEIMRRLHTVAFENEIYKVKE